MHPPHVWSWKQAIWESNLTATTKIVLQALGSHLNDFGDPMFPSQERLARLCSLSERSVISHLQIAEEAGWIQPRKRELKGSKWAANEYVACWPNGVNVVHPRGEGRSPGGVKEFHPNNPDELSNRNPPTPRGEPEGFEEIWKAKWSRGPQQHIRARALKAYAAALKRGHEPEDLLVAVKACAGVSKPGTEYAPMLSTWLNEERWKDAGGAVVILASDVEASRQRQQAADQAYQAQIKAAQEQRRREMGFIS